MGVVDELAAAIAEDPQDAEPQLVIADLLQAEGDPRGELIALDRAERDGRLHDADALERLLLLAAEYSFPYAPGVEDPPLPFEITERDPLVWEVHHGAGRFTMTTEDAGLIVRLREPGNDGFPNAQYDYAIERDFAWTDGGFSTVHAILSDVIRARSPFPGVRFPFMILQLPTYDGGPLRCYQLPTTYTISRGIPRNRYGLAARDHHRWNQIWDRLRGR